MELTDTNQPWGLSISDDRSQRTEDRCIRRASASDCVNCLWLSDILWCKQLLAALLFDCLFYITYCFTLDIDRFFNSTYGGMLICLLSSDIWLLMFTAVIAKRFHPFPFRTRKLSSSAPMVLHGRLCGRVERCRVIFQKALYITKMCRAFFLLAHLLVCPVCIFFQQSFLFFISILNSFWVL